MIKIDLDTPYKCSRFRSGASEKGRWEIVTVLDSNQSGKNWQEVTIFPASAPSGLYEGCMFTVKRILSVARKKGRDREGNWTRVDVCITADVELVKDELNMDGDLPFTFGAYDSDDDSDAADLKDLLGPSEATDLL